MAANDPLLVLSSRDGGAAAAAADQRRNELLDDHAAALDPKWQRFLAELERTGDARTAADFAPVSRSSAYYHFDRSASFHALWKRARNRFTERCVEDFISALRRYGKPARAAKASGLSRWKAYRLRSSCPDFRQLWQRALEDHRALRSFAT